MIDFVLLARWNAIAVPGARAAAYAALARESSELAGILTLRPV